MDKVVDKVAALGVPGIVLAMYINVGSLRCYSNVSVASF